MDDLPQSEYEAAECILDEIGRAKRGERDVDPDDLHLGFNLEDVRE